MTPEEKRRIIYYMSIDRHVALASGRASPGFLHLLHLKDWDDDDLANYARLSLTPERIVAFDQLAAVITPEERMRLDVARSQELLSLDTLTEEERQNLRENIKSMDTDLSDME